MNKDRIESQVDDLLDMKIASYLEDYVRDMVKDKIRDIDVSDFVDIDSIVESVLVDEGIL